MVTFLITIVLIAVYFFPWINSLCRKHPNSTAILLLNLFLGWTLIGWVGALVWSAVAIKQNNT
jgi:hypothetical protein